MLKKFFKQWDLQLMVWPGLILIIIFSYLPMFGLAMAFQDYNLFKGFLGSPFVGVKHFEAFFNDPRFPRIMRNTLAISSMKIVFAFPAPILLAILINEIRKPIFKRSVQTISYLPHFLSWVVVAGIVKSVLSADNGALNHLLIKWGWVEQPINFLSQPNLFWPIIILTNIWKSIGFNSIIYLAAIAGIDPGLYEVAKIDGANRFQQMIYVTLPSLFPIITVFLILDIGNLLNAGFEDLLLLGSNPVLREVAEVIDTYVYRVGIQSFRYSYATAVGLFKSVISIILLTAANYFARKTENSLW